MQTSRTSAAEPVTNRQLLSFALSGEDYGIDILRVREIRGWEPIRSLPDAPDYIRGVLNLRGTLVPILDLRIRFGQPAEAYTATTVVIITSAANCVEGRERLLGLIVDSVQDVLECRREQMREPPDLGERPSAAFMAGMLVLEQGMVVELDPGLLLGSRQLAVLEAQIGSGPDA